MTATAPTARRPRVSARLAWLAAAALCTVTFVLVYIVAVRTTWGQTIDISLFAQVQAGSTPIELVASWLRAGLPVLAACACAVLAVLAARSGRWRSIGTAAAVVILTVPCATVLRTAILTRPFLGESGYPYNTLPSGHVALTAALGVAAVVLADRHARPLVALGATATALVACVVSVVGHAHRPSDTLASLLLVGALACTTLALVPARDGPDST